MSSNVLRGNPLGALTKDFFVTSLLFPAEFSFRVGVQIRTIAAQGEHQKQLRVHPRRPNPGGSELLAGRSKHVPEHKEILIVELTVAESRGQRGPRSGTDR